MSDARDTNHDGKVSLMEKVKDKLHLGHTTTQHTSTTAGHNSHDLNHDGHISASERLKTVSTGEKVAAGSALVAGSALAAGAAHSSTKSGAHDSRDLNRDGHISTGERLTAGSTGSMMHDSRDLNRDGHISTGERLAAGHTSEEARLRLHEEQLAISKREVGAGEVDIHKRVQEQHVQQMIPVRREEVIVERRPLEGIADPNARIASQDETMRVALFREEIVTEKRIVPTEEVIIRKKEVIDQQAVGATLRSEHLETIQTGMQNTSLAGGAYDARDTNRDGHLSMGEKLKGDTFGTNNMVGTGLHDARDTNRDGHVSMGEKLKSDAFGTNKMATTGIHDARDTNLDGRVSMGEKVKGAAVGTTPLKAARG
jgi:uncharacterized protein (TIGR02271 family)